MSDDEIYAVDEDSLCKQDEAEWHAWKDEAHSRERRREEAAEADPLAGVDDHLVSVQR